MKQQKNQPQTPPQEVPAKPLREVPKVERERAENEGMTVKPNRDSTNLEDVKIGKAHSQEPQNDGLEGEGSYTAARRYREGLERSVQEGDADKLATDAADALDGPEGADLRHAEQRGKMSPPGVQKEQQKLQQKDQDVQHKGQQVQQKGSQQAQQRQQGKKQRGYEQPPVSHR